MFRRFLIAFLVFAGLVGPGAFILALLAASAYPAPAPVLGDGYAVVQVMAR